jgi:hypothetical protein
MKKLAILLLLGNARSVSTHAYAYGLLEKILIIIANTVSVSVTKLRCDVH